MLDVIRMVPPPWRPGAEADEILRYFRMLPHSSPWKGCPQDGGIRRVDDYRRHPCEKCGHRRFRKAAMWRRKLGLSSDPITVTPENKKKRKITATESSASGSPHTPTESPTTARVTRSRALSALGKASSPDEDVTSTVKRRRVDTATASYNLRTSTQLSLASLQNEDSRSSVAQRVSTLRPAPPLTVPTLLQPATPRVPTWPPAAASIILTWPQAGYSSLRTHANHPSVAMPGTRGVQSIARPQQLGSPLGPSGSFETSGSRALCSILAHSEDWAQSPLSSPDYVDNDDIDTEDVTKHSQIWLE